MAQNNKVRTGHTKKMVNRTKTSKKKTSNRKLSFFSNLMPKSRKGVIKAVIAAIAIVTIAGAIPLPYTFAKSMTVPFTTESTQYAGLELGDSKVLLEGREGSKTATISSLQSIWGRLFGWQPIQQKEVTATIAEKPVNKVVANGTRKYQYMLCSNGSYRYYTDEQFKDADTGFTSKSNDYCKENNQGTKLKLADSQDGTINNSVASNAIDSTPTPKGCSKSSIPFGTEYQNASYLPKGTRQVASQGMNGFILSCPGQGDIKSSGVDQLVLIGTGKTDAEIQAENDAKEVQRQQEEAERDQRYYINLANCVQNLKAQGMQASSAESHCRSIVRR